MNPDFASVQLYCDKKGCDKTRLQRHHKGHEYIWVASWIRRRSSEPRFQKFCRRYWSFDDRDITRICHEHHAEIHYMYRVIIDEHIFKHGSMLQSWTWKQADALMSELRNYCDEWLKKQTAGMNPDHVFLKN